MFSGFWRAPDGVGFARSVSSGPPLSPDIVAAPSSATTSATPPGSVCCNNADAPAEGESAAGSPLAGTGGSADAGGSTPPGQLFPLKTACILQRIVVDLTYDANAKTIQVGTPDHGDSLDQGPILHP